jgi:hypothetical protein
MTLSDAPSKGTAMKEKSKGKNSLLWLLEPLEDDPRFVQRKLASLIRGAGLCGDVE